jgi:hypothetical protein
MVLIQKGSDKMKSNIYWIIIQVLEHGEYYTKLNDVEMNEILRNGLSYAKSYDNVYRVFKLEN